VTKHWRKAAKEDTWLNGLLTFQPQDVLAAKSFGPNMSWLLYMGLKCPSVLKQWCNFTQVWNVE